MKKERITEMQKRFEDKLVLYGLDKKQFTIRVLEETNEKCTLKSFNNAYSNFNQDMKGVNRNFPPKYYLAIEKILHTSMNYLINGNDEELDDCPITIRKAARLDDVTLLKNLRETEARYTDGNGILFNMDEYEKTIFDYIIEFKDKNKDQNCLKYLIDEGFIAFDYDNPGFNYKHINITASANETIKKQFLILLLKLDDAKRFNLITNANSITHIDYFNEYKGSLFDDLEITELIANSKKVFKSCCGIKMGIYDGDEVAYVSELLKRILIFMLNSPKNYDSKIMEIVKSYDDLYAYVESKLDEGKYLTITNNFVIVDSKYVGFIDDLQLTETINCGEETYKKIDNLKERREMIVSKITGSKIAHRKALNELDGYVIKDKSNNEIEYSFLKLMEENKIPFIPFLGEEKLGKDAFIKLEGNTCSRYCRSNVNIPISLARCFKEIQDVSSKKLGSNKTYCHGDLDVNNVLVLGNEVTGIVDWDETYIGNKYDNIIDIFINFTDVQYVCKNPNDTLDLLVDIVNIFEDSEDFKENFANKIIERINYWSAKLDRDGLDYFGLAQSYEIAKFWVETYKDQITQLIG